MNDVTAAALGMNPGDTVRGAPVPIVVIGLSNKEATVTPEKAELFVVEEAAKLDAQYDDGSKRRNMNAVAEEAVLSLLRSINEAQVRQTTKHALAV